MKSENHGWASKIIKSSLNIAAVAHGKPLACESSKYRSAAFLKARAEDGGENERRESRL